MAIADSGIIDNIFEQCRSTKLSAERIRSSLEVVRRSIEEHAAQTTMASCGKLRECSRAKLDQTVAQRALETKNHLLERQVADLLRELATQGANVSKLEQEKRVLAETIGVQRIEEEKMNHLVAYLQARAESLCGDAQAKERAWESKWAKIEETISCCFGEKNKLLSQIEMMEEEINDSRTRSGQLQLALNEKEETIQLLRALRSQRIEETSLCIAELVDFSVAGRQVDDEDNHVLMDKKSAVEQNFERCRYNQPELRNLRSAHEVEMKEKMSYIAQLERTIANLETQRQYLPEKANASTNAIFECDVAKAQPESMERQKVIFSTSRGSQTVLLFSPHGELEHERNNVQNCTLQKYCTSSELQGEIAELKATITQQNNSLEQSALLFSRMQAICEERQHEVNQLKRELSESRTELAQVSSELSLARALAMEEQRNNSTLHQFLAEKEKQCQGFQNMLEKRKSETEKHEKAARTCELRLQEMEKALRDKGDDLALEKEKVIRCATECVDQARCIQILTEMNQKEKEDKQQLARTLADERKEKEMALEKCAKLENDHQRMQAELHREMKQRQLFADRFALEERGKREIEALLLPLSNKDPTLLADSENRLLDVARELYDEVPSLSSQLRSCKLQLHELEVRFVQSIRKPLLDDEDLTETISALLLDIECDPEWVSSNVPGKRCDDDQPDLCSTFQMNQVAVQVDLLCRLTKFYKILTGRFAKTFATLSTNHNMCEKRLWKARQTIDRLGGEEIIRKVLEQRPHLLQVLLRVLNTLSDAQTYGANIESKLLQESDEGHQNGEYLLDQLQPSVEQLMTRLSEAQGQLDEAIMAVFTPDERSCALTGSQNDCLYS